MTHWKGQIQYLRILQIARNSQFKNLLEGYYGSQDCRESEETALENGQKKTATDTVMWEAQPSTLSWNGKISTKGLLLTNHLFVFKSFVPDAKASQGHSIS